MSSFKETWPVNHPPSDDSINGDQTWTILANANGFVVTSHAATQTGDNVHHAVCLRAL